MGDTVAVDGWDVSAYSCNSVVLWAHRSDEPPVGRLSNIFSDGTRLLGDVEFVPPEVYGFADTVFKMVKEDFVKAGSVGFLPKRFEYSKDPDRPGEIDFLEQELLEFSIVPVPANSSALVAAKRMGAPKRHLDQLQGRMTLAQAEAQLAVLEARFEASAKRPADHVVRIRELRRLTRATTGWR